MAKPPKPPSLRRNVPSDAFPITLTWSRADTREVVLALTLLGPTELHVPALATEYGAHIDVVVEYATGEVERA